MTTRKVREFWILTPDMSESGNFVKGTYLCSSERPSEQHIDHEYVIHVREVVKEPTIVELFEMAKQANACELHFRQGFRAALEWMKGTT